MSPDEMVRSIYRWFELRDLSRIGSLLADNVVWMQSPADLSCVGKGRVLAHFELLIQSSAGHHRWRLQHLYTHGTGRVVSLHETTTTETSSAVYECLLFEVDVGLIERIVPLAPVPCSLS
jgi:ketosteroid isomerase-like protein